MMMCDGDCWLHRDGWAEGVGEQSGRSMYVSFRHPSIHSSSHMHARPCVRSHTFHPGASFLRRPLNSCAPSCGIWIWTIQLFIPGQLRTPLSYLRPSSLCPFGLSFRSQFPDLLDSTIFSSCLYRTQLPPPYIVRILLAILVTPSDNSPPPTTVQLPRPTSPSLPPHTQPAIFLLI